ncbi:MAG: hypothetical protein QG564_1707 [Campylobacterota bacterium]|nr:hypothetical protein [Campylobacterota bacterium]
MIKKYFMGLFFILLASSFMQAKTLKADYKVSFGIFGEIGTAKALLDRNNTQYTIDIHLDATGVAKTLSRGRTERHISRGRIVDGVMRSDFYKVIRTDSSRAVNKEYFIDHKNKKVIKTYKKFKNGKLVSEKKSVLDFYAKNDLLTLYFNLDQILKDKTTPHRYTFQAVGAERQDGKVSLVIPQVLEPGRYKKTLGSGADWYATAIIHEKIFLSKEGELMLSVGKDGVAQKAVLKDVIFFGDIRAERIR